MHTKNKSILKKRRQRALDPNRGVLSSILRLFIIGLILGITLFVFLSFFITSGEKETITKEQLQKAVEKVKKEGVVTKNIKYKNSKNKVNFEAKLAVQNSKGMNLENVKLDVNNQQGRATSEKATIDKDSNRVKMFGNVNYNQVDGLKIKSNMLEIEKNNNVKGQGDITVIKGGAKLMGREFDYNSKDKILKMQGNIKIIIEE